MKEAKDEKKLRKEWGEYSAKEYKNFRICFLNVDKYLRIEPTDINKTDADRITEICKNQYAEAKIAFETLAVYWNHYRSGIDGQTIVYIASHTSEFQE
ncbi:MAG: hypothetical protein NC517_10670 [Firmicutes bacterium]|nr:hypothetical protein [Bacillota bacterium]